MRLKLVYAKYIPLKRFIALTLCPWIIIRKDKKDRFNATLKRHESTHALQQIECLWVGFFLLYILEYIIKVCCTFSLERAYKAISFEQEAYEHQDEIYYNEVRKHYAWIKYIFKLK